MATVRFKLRANRKHPLPTVSVVIRQGNDRALLATPFKVSPSHWSAKRERIRNTSEVPARFEINTYLDELHSALHGYITAEALAKRPNPPVVSLKAYALRWMGKGVAEDVSTDLVAFAAHHCDRLGEGRVTRSAKPVTPQTLVGYRQTLRKLRDFASATGRSTRLSGINSEFYGAFVTYLNAEGLALNSVGKQVKTLKTFLAEADAAGHVVCQDFRKGLFKGLRENSDRIALDLPELLSIAGADLSGHSEGHRRARDLFTLAAFTGLRFSDVVALGPENIADGAVVVVNQKTGKRTSAPLLGPASGVLDRNGGRPPGKLSNQKANAYLKEVAKVAGVGGHHLSGRTIGGKREAFRAARWELVTTHTARRSFVTLTKRLDVDAESVSRATGHSSARMLGLYDKTTEAEAGRTIRAAYAAAVDAIGQPAPEPREATVRRLA